MADQGLIQNLHVVISPRVPPTHMKRPIKLQPIPSKREARDSPMDPLVQPTPSYPPNYTHSSQSNTPNDSPVHGPSRKNSSGLSLPSFKRDKSFLSLASLNLAHSSSSLLEIFSSALDSVPPTPHGTPPPLVERRGRGDVIEEVNKWMFIRETVRSISILFALGYAFAMYHPL